MTLKGVVKEEDIPQLAKDAYADACRPGNPRDTSVEDIEALYDHYLNNNRSSGGTFVPPFCFLLMFLIKNV